MDLLALVDCENFYASCERIFRPDLKKVPIVVLSNNDGCVIARSKESKDFGIQMGAPWFKVKEDFLKERGSSFFVELCFIRRYFKQGHERTISNVKKNRDIQY